MWECVEALVVYAHGRGLECGFSYEGNLEYWDPARCGILNFSAREACRVSIPAVVSTAAAGDGDADKKVDEIVQFVAPPSPCGILSGGTAR